MANVRQDNVQIKLEIDGSQSRTELDNLTRKAQVLQDGFKGLKKGSEEYVAQNKELSQVKARMEELRNEIGLTSLSSAQLKAMSNQLNRELAQLTPNTESFLNKAQELANVDARLAQVRLEAKGVKDELGNAGGGIGDFIKKAAGFVGIQLGIQALVSGLKQLGSESIDAAVKGSDSIADMEKALNLTTAEAHGLRDALAGIDTRTSQEDLEKIAIGAGQLGIAKDQAVAFTESVNQANVALGDEFSGGVEEVTKTLGGLQKLFKETKDVSPADAITKIGSAVNALGADGAATGPVIAEFTARIGQLGDLAPQITQTLGLGAAFQELGLEASISSGGITNVLQTASKETAGFAKQLGMTEEAFKDLINNNPNEVLLRLGESFKGASNTEITQTLAGLKITSQEATKTVSLLATQTDLVRQKQALASAEYEKGTSLLEEYAKKNTDAAADVAKAEKSYAQFRLELGEMLIPVYIKVLQYGGLLVSMLRALPAFVSENKTAFALLAAGIVTLNSAQIIEQATLLRGLALRKLVALGIVVETAAMVEGEVATYSLASAQGALNTAMSANPIGFIITLMALFAFGLKQLYDRSETFRAAVDSLFTMLKPLGSLFGSLAAQLGPLFSQLSRFFGSFSSGKGALDLFGQVMAISVVLPLKYMVANVQFAVDALGVLWETGKRVANFFGADFKIDNGAFDNFRKNTEANAKSMLDTLTGQDGAAAKAAQTKRFDDYAAELTRKHSQQVEAAAKAQVLEQKAAADKKADDAKNDLESLKNRLANIKAALALVAVGSAEELRLKKLEVATKRDIDLLDEKKTAGDKKVIRAEALRDLRQLQDDYDKKTKDAAEKRAKEEADVQKKIADLKAALLTDETEKKIQQLNAAAEKDKATAKGTAEQIAEQRRLIDAKLAVDIAAERQKQAQKRGEEELDIEKRQNALIVNEWQRRAAELRTAAAGELLKVLDADANAAEKRRLIQAKLQQDLVALEAARVEQQREIAARILAIDDDIALQRIQRRKQQGDIFNADRNKAAQEETDLKKQQLQEQYDLDIQNVNLTNEERLALKRKLDQDMRNVDQDYLDWSKMTADEQRDYAFGVVSQGVQAISDFQKIASDKELAKIDKDKKARLAKLDQEYKAGLISKDQYETQKTSIEAKADEETRQIKTQAAQREKEANVAQSIIQGVLAVLKAGGPFTPTGAITAIFSALATAKIIATPIPEFAKGGVIGGARPAWRERVRQFASGGRINSTAGVANAGQRHSGGGIRMVDGATGEHLGEWERGEPYMILSRDTYANNRELVDDLLDTSMNRGGAPVRPRSSYFEDGGVSGGSPATSGGSSTGGTGQELVQAMRETRDAVRALPSRQYVAWTGEDTANVEEALNERESDRQGAQIR